MTPEGLLGGRIRFGRLDLGEGGPRLHFISPIAGITIIIGGGMGKYPGLLYSQKHSPTTREITSRDWPHLPLLYSLLGHLPEDTCSSIPWTAWEEDPGDRLNGG